ncbi:MAG: circularly permuted type 2 ATP-grasp protein [Candidatus Hydrogenedentes bacterium]|nr:circularly permuted type 2 ATP-grasp protein [Candidatus Hydrogenedentota bacterium]
MAVEQTAALAEAYAAACLNTWNGNPSVFDEVCRPGPELRTHWQDYLATINRFGPEEMARRCTLAHRLIHENGITYNVYADPLGVDRPWALDTIPYLISASEWQLVEAGLAQRARLLNLIAADIYGPQRIIKEGVLPVEFVHANPKFLRACHGAPLQKSGHVTLYGADMLRTPSGAWAVFGDRTQTPSGMGYSLENRIIMSRVFPNLIRDCQVQRLASFFETLRGVLRELAPRPTDSPNVALLTPGPYNETYFEHAYLARYLGFTLTEGEDLTVRDRSVYLKTLEGLQRVDVIFRRLDDDFCDPLELRNDSTLGIVGLIQTLHQNNVAVSNMLGSAVLEVRPVAASLQRLSRYFLGEDLRLPSAPSWWCALPEDRAYVDANFDSLYIAPAWSLHPNTLIHVAELSAEQRATLRARIAAEPHAFVGLEPVTLSTAPAWIDNSLQQRYISLRTYTLSAGDGAFHTMPGGLTRFSSSCDLRNLTMQSGSGSKDTWVRSDRPVEPFSLLPPPGQPIILRRSPMELPSRLADNLFWLGRYCERTDGVVRMLRHLANRFTDEAGLMSIPELKSMLRAIQQCWPELVPGQAVDRSTGIEALRPNQDCEDSAAIERSLLAAVFNEELPGSVVSNLRALQRTAWVVRDRISRDDWRIISGISYDLLMARRQHTPQSVSDALAILDEVIVGLAAFSGLTMENMTRERGWLFLNMGRRLERALHTARLIERVCVSPHLPEESTLQAVLIINDSPMTYRARYGANFRASAILDLLLCDESNPRSVAFQLHSIRHDLLELPHTMPRGLLSDEEQIIVRILAELRLTDVHALGRLSKDNRRPKLAEFLPLILDGLPRFSDFLARHYFNHTGPARRFTARQSEIAT